MINEPDANDDFIGFVWDADLVRARECIEAGTDVRACNDRAIYNAAIQDDAAMIELIIGTGAYDEGLSKSVCEHPIVKKIWESRRMKQMIKQSPRIPNGALVDAVEAGDIEEIRVQLTIDENVNTRIELAIIRAVQAGDVEIAKLLLDAGADPNTVIDESHRLNLLSHAISVNNEPMIDRLLESGADPNALQQAAVHYAHWRDKESIRVMKKLIDKGVDVKCGDYWILRAFSAQQNHESIEYILEYANLDDADIEALKTHASLHSYIERWQIGRGVKGNGRKESEWLGL